MSESADAYGDGLGPLQRPLSEALMNAVMALPSVLDAQVEGRDGPVSIPADQSTEMMEKQVLAVLNALPTIAGALDLARARITRLEQRLADLEGD
jgi:hypothetical protein